MPTDSVACVWDALRRYEGVPSWWAEVFVNIGLSAEEAVTWVETAQRDESSALSKLREKELNVTLQGYARARGISLMGVGDGDEGTSTKLDHLVHKVSTVITHQEQEVVLREVEAFADVEFREKVNGVYSQHAVANAVRSVHGAYLSKVVGDVTVLEAGASVKSAVLSGVDPAKRHCCSPVLDVRDSVRHSLRGWLSSVVRDTSKYKERVRRAASAALDPDSGFVCRSRAQDCTKQVEAICSNESTHDVPFDDLPLIMARHGARIWVGFMTRAPGVRSVGGPNAGSSRALGTRWRLDRERDKITFHFDRDGSFSYAHKFSQWIKYEEQFGFRWRGRYFDYVYSRMPITTASSLAFVVVRVPKVMAVLKEPVYKESHLAGMVEVTSVRAVGGCLGGKTPEFEPVKFALEAVVFERVLETRLSQGDRGNLASTMAYMRSARVKLSVNGVALGTVTNVPVDLLEPAAVAVEVLAADGRWSGERDYGAIMRAAAGDRSFQNILSYFSGLQRLVGQVTGCVSARIKTALLAVLSGRSPVVVRAQQCAPYVKVSDGGGVGDVTVHPEFSVRTCGCSELTAVNAALAMGNALSKQERRELSSYADVLAKAADGCVVHDVHRVSEEEAEDAFFDAAEEVSDGASTVPLATGVGSASTGGTSSRGTQSTAATSECASETCESLCEEGSVLAESEESESGTVSAMREYACWAQAADKAARSEARLDADVMFLQGNPTLQDVERATTARTRHAVVAVVDGAIQSVFGTLRPEEEFAEVYVRSLRRTCKVFSGRRKQRYIKESVTELCYTNSGLLVMNGDELCRGAMSVLQDLPRGFEFPKYTFVNGVPGCGKTWEIKHEMLRLIRAGKSVMYLTATKASCEHVERFVSRESSVGAAVCRTYDSYLINGATPVGRGSVDALFMDEAPMVHKGELFACMVKASAITVRMYGDTKQIPWLSFMAAFDARHWKLGNEVEMEYRTVSHRFGAYTCAMWLDVYGRISPCECCEHEEIPPEVVAITSCASLPDCREGKTLVFTQEEKMTVKREKGFSASIQTLKSMDKGGLSTAAEDQGGSHDAVHVVRLVNKKNPKESKQSPSIYNKQPWVLVATTRQRGRLVYYTTAEDDLVRARIALASCGVRLDAVRKGKPWEEVKHRARLVREFGI